MRRGVYVAVLLVAMATGCRDFGSNPPSNGPAGDQTAAGKFVVDQFAVECTVKVNPSTSSLQACFPWRVKYHFEGQPGSVFNMGFTPVGFLSTYVFASPASPDSVGRVYSMSSEFRTNSSLAQMDSVVVRFGLGGVYWDRVDGKERTYGSFDWSVEKTLPVRHQ